MEDEFSNNPIDTAAQRQYERRALEVFQHPKFLAAKEDVAAYWLREVNPSDDARRCFNAAFDEVCFGAIIWSLNQNPLDPQVITISRVQHQLDELTIPGSRWGIDNPDSVYRVIPISGAQRYRITGRVPEKRLSENYFTLWDRQMGTIDVLDGADLVLDDQRRFSISVDSEPAGDRANHIQSSAEAHQFYIRDVLQNWGEERVNELAIELLDTAADTTPRDLDFDVKRGIDYLWNYATNTMRWNRQATDRPDNAFDFKIDRDVDGALRNQIYIMGVFRLAEGEAMVIDVNLGGANYFIAPITNYWGTTNDVVTQNGSLNLHQSVANKDGTYTFVVSADDPGIHNWLNPDGMREGILTLRWAEFNSGEPEETLSASARLVRYDNLGMNLPASAPRLDAQQREQQHAERAQSYAWRISTND